MRKLVKGLFIAVIIASTAFFYYDYKLSNDVTVRNIDQASRAYMFAYPTHGGTGYITQSEHFILDIADNIVTGLFGLMIVATVALSAMSKKSRQ